MAVWVNNTLIEDRNVMEITDYTYIYFTYNNSIQEVQIIGTNASSPSVGGDIPIPTNKLELFAPYIGLALAISVTAVVTIVFLKHRKKQ